MSEQELDAEQQVDAPQPDEAETKARKMGWRPKEEYRGDPTKWVDAGEFLRQTEEEFPRLKHANQTLMRTVERLEKGQQEIIAHQERQLQQTRKEAYEQAQRDIQAQHREAVQAGDVDGAEKALKAGIALKAQADTQLAPPAQSGPKPLSTADQETVKEWIAENGWFVTDPVMSDYAKKYENSLAQQGMGLEERLKKTTAYIMRKFPNEFQVIEHEEANMEESPPPPRMVNGSRSNGMNRPKQKPKHGTYEALTPEGKTACDRYIATNADKAKAKADWLRFATPDLFVQ